MQTDLRTAPNTTKKNNRQVGFRNISLSLVFLAFLMIRISPVVGQVVELIPSQPTITDTVTLVYHADRGNGVLKDFKGDLYLHTGVITDKSMGTFDWKHVVGNWGKADPKVKMKRIANNSYSFRLVIGKFYGLKPNEKVQQLCFVFRNAKGNLVGKTKDNKDILIPVFGYQPPVKKTAAYLFRNRHYLSHHISNGNLEIQTDHGILQCFFYSPTMVQIINKPLGTRTPDSSVAIIANPMAQTGKVEEQADYLIYHSDSLQVVIHKSPFYLSYVYHHDTILQEEKGYFRRTNQAGLRFKTAPKEHYYGLGERAVRKLKGHRFELYNQAHYAYEMGAQNLNFSVPVLVSSKRYLLFFDNPQKGYADVGKTEPNILELGAVGGLMKYVFIAGNNYPALYRQYGKLTGTQPLPPRWALGNLQSRMAYRSQKEADSIVDLMQRGDFPMDALILDFYWFGDSIKGYLGKLDWYKPHWPHPEEMIANFRKRGIKTVLITEPYIIDTLANYHIANRLGILATDSTGKTYNNSEFYFGPAGLIDIFKPSAQNWFWQQYERQIKIGVAGWWGDLGEPETHPFDEYCIGKSAREIHNLYAFYWEKMLFEKYRQTHPQTRLFDLNRAGYAGSQRFGVYPWSGDVSRSWGGLQAQLPIMINMSLSGLPMIHADAGGFAQGDMDNELYTRWLQFACFSPILRPHGSGIPSEPVFFNDTTQQIVRSFMKLRYRLLPYLYTAAWEANQEGSPIVKPLFYEFPNDSVAYHIINEYFLGHDLLIAPILQPKLKTKRLYLPQGTWYSWWNAKKYDGGQWIEVPVTLETIPIFVRAGAFIPMVKAVNSTDHYNSGNLTIRFYPEPTGKSSEDYLFEDDGKSNGTVERGDYEILRFSQKGNQHFEFSTTTPNRHDKIKKRKIQLQVMGEKQTRTVTFSLKSRKHIEVQ